MYTIQGGDLSKNDDALHRLTSAPGDQTWSNDHRPLWGKRICSTVEKYCVYILGGRFVFGTGRLSYELGSKYNIRELGIGNPYAEGGGWIMNRLQRKSICILYNTWWQNLDSRYMCFNNFEKEIRKDFALAPLFGDGSGFVMDNILT